MNSIGIALSLSLAIIFIAYLAKHSFVNDEETQEEV